jgi:hypothetical protein
MFERSALLGCWEIYQPSEFLKNCEIPVGLTISMVQHVELLVECCSGYQSADLL